MKLLRNICTTIAVLGFIIALGTAGASDTNTIGINQIYTQLVIALIMLVSGAIGTSVCNNHKCKQKAIQGNIEDIQSYIQRT